VQWWRLAARQGSSQAAYNLGFLYSQEVNEDDDDDDEDSAGNGSLKQDFVEALKWYREAAAAGNTGAEYNLGVMHQQRLPGKTESQARVQITTTYRKRSLHHFLFSKKKPAVLKNFRLPDGPGLRPEVDKCREPRQFYRPAGPSVW